MANEYKPGWEQTMMAEDTFKWMVAIYCARNWSSVQLASHREEVHGRFDVFADLAMDASEIFDKKRKHRKFPNMVELGNSTNE